MNPDEWFGTKIGPGENANVELVISESYSSRDVAIPLRICRGENPGPTVFVTAALHGDELNGTGAIRGLLGDSTWKIDAGTVLLVPVLNVLGFERHSRYLPDRRDLNRVFPGTTSGSMASRLGKVIFDSIVRRCDYGIDLHTAAVRRTNFPNARADMDNPACQRLAEAFGAGIIIGMTTLPAVQPGEPVVHIGRLANQKSAERHDRRVERDDVQRTAHEHLATNIQVTEPTETPD